jgi:hypothetical protein
LLFTELDRSILPLLIGGITERTFRLKPNGDSRPGGVDWAWEIADVSESFSGVEAALTKVKNLVGFGERDRLRSRREDGRWGCSLLLAWKE